MRISYVEIYNEQIKDMLEPYQSKNNNNNNNINKAIRVREDPLTGNFIDVCIHQFLLLLLLLHPILSYPIL